MPYPDRPHNVAITSQVIGDLSYLINGPWKSLQESPQASFLLASFTVACGYQGNHLYLVAEPAKGVDHPLDVNPFSILTERTMMINDPQPSVSKASPWSEVFPCASDTSRSPSIATVS